MRLEWVITLDRTNRGDDLITPVVLFKVTSHAMPVQLHQHIIAQQYSGVKWFPLDLLIMTPFIELVNMRRVFNPGKPGGGGWNLFIIYYENLIQRAFFTQGLLGLKSSLQEKCSHPPSHPPKIHLTGWLLTEKCCCYRLANWGTVIQVVDNPRFISPVVNRSLVTVLRAWPDI